MFFSVSNRNDVFKKVKFECLFLLSRTDVNQLRSIPFQKTYMCIYLKTIILMHCDVYVCIHVIYTCTNDQVIWKLKAMYSTACFFQHLMQLSCHHSLHQVVFQEFLSCDLIWAWRTALKGGGLASKWDNMTTQKKTRPSWTGRNQLTCGL